MTLQFFEVRPTEDDPLFEGVGAVNGGGATSVLLKDYPEPQRSQILDLVFTPKFGASVSALLAEVPGDGNSTQGSMPSHMHTRDDLSSERGYTWWILREACRRNPGIALDAVAWSAPGWVGDGEFWSQDAADYYSHWLQLLRDDHGVHLDALGCRNEKGVSLDFAKRLRTTLDAAGFEDVRIHAFDNWTPDKFDFVAALDADPAARDAIAAIGAHVLYERGQDGPSAEVRSWARRNGKPIWNTEDHVYRPGFACLIGIVECLNESYVVSGATRTVLWYDIAGVYPLEPYAVEPAMIVAHEPWSGRYEVRDALWGYAHYGQFTERGWRYVDGACGRLQAGGTSVALASADGELTLIIETKDADREQRVHFDVSALITNRDLTVWRSTADDVFARQPDARVRKGLLQLDLEPNAVYSVSTTTGQRKGEYEDIPPSAPFPYPYGEDFTGYDVPALHGMLPRYTADISGAFEVAVDDDGPHLRQAVTAPTISWAPDWHPYTIFGDQDWSDYEVSVDIRLEADDVGGVMSRINDVGTGYGVTPKAYLLELSSSGLWRLVSVNGKKDKTELVGDAEQQARIRASDDVSPGGETVLASGSFELRGSSSRIALRCTGTEIRCFIDGVLVTVVLDSTHRAGMAGLFARHRGDRTSTPRFGRLLAGPAATIFLPTPAHPSWVPIYAPRELDAV